MLMSTCVQAILGRLFLRGLDGGAIGEATSTSTSFSLAVYNTKWRIRRQYVLEVYTTPYKIKYNVLMKYLLVMLKFY